MDNRRGFFLGVIALATLAGVKILYALRGAVWMVESIGAWFAMLLIGVPLVLRLRGTVRLEFVASDRRRFLQSFVVGGCAALLILPLYLAGNHLYQVWLWGMAYRPAAPFSWSAVMASQFLWVALPEEFFFRGFLQEECNRLWGYRWRIFGVSVGWGLFVVALVFALGHSFIAYRWWHLFIFFPGLVFGFLRELSGGIVAPILFHTAANVAAQWIALHYR